jgi:hypothetical protein
MKSITVPYSYKDASLLVLTNIELIGPEGRWALIPHVVTSLSTGYYSVFDTVQGLVLGTVYDIKGHWYAYCPCTGPIESAFNVHGQFYTAGEAAAALGESVTGAKHAKDLL